MEYKQYDMDCMYHHLRHLRNNSSRETQNAFKDLANHMLSSNGDYPSLLRFLDYYGTKFILPKVTEVIRETGIQFERVIDIGAGLGWLGRGLKYEFSVDLITIDNRQWPLIDIVADVETKNGRTRVLDILRPEGELIVMCELLHCLEDPESLLNSLSCYPMIVIEYRSINADFQASYQQQISSLGCKNILMEEIQPRGTLMSKTCAGPYSIYTLTPKGQ